MTQYVFDLEANGLLDTADTVWCAVFKDINTLKKEVFVCPKAEDIVPFLDRAELLIGHNIVDYDIPLLSKVYNWSAPSKFIDTLIWSKLLRNRKAHSIESYGEEYGIPKPEHEDWSQYSEEMLHRCAQDVDITFKVWEGLVDETENLQGYMLRKRT